MRLFRFRLHDPTRHRVDIRCNASVIPRRAQQQKIKEYNNNTNINTMPMYPTRVRVRSSARHGKAGMARQQGK